MKRSLLRLGIGAFFLAATVTAGGESVHAADSTWYPWIRTNVWVNMPLGTVAHGGSLASSGHIGVDIWMPDGYAPCHNPAESLHAACLHPGVSYYKVFNYWPIGNRNFPYGMFVDSSNNGLTHEWARKIGGMSAEIYPYGPSVNCGGQPAPCYPYVFEPNDPAAVGGVRIQVNSFSGGYSPSPGNVDLPKFGQAGVVYLNGFAYRNGAPSSNLTIDVFGHSAVTNRSSTGYPVVSFSSGGSKPDGYYNTGPLIKGASGNFSVYFGDTVTQKKILCTIHVPVAGTVVYLDFAHPNGHFGLSGCQQVGW